MIKRNNKKKNYSKYYKILNAQNIFHCDFEIGISNAVEKVCPNINTKYLTFYYKSAFEKNKY